MNCPKCGAHTENKADTWPIKVRGKIKPGGCQDCWEIECDNKWWLAMRGEK